MFESSLRNEEVKIGVRFYGVSCCVKRKLFLIWSVGAWLCAFCFLLYCTIPHILIFIDWTFVENHLHDCCTLLSFILHYVLCVLWTVYFYTLLVFVNIFNVHSKKLFFVRFRLLCSVSENSFVGNIPISLLFHSFKLLNTFSTECHIWLCDTCSYPTDYIRTSCNFEHGLLDIKLVWNLFL